MRSSWQIPPAFTPTYDHELAASLARAGADVELVTSHFRFGEAPAADGYARRELFYPLSSRLFGRSRLRLPLKIAEHPFGLAALRARSGDVIHLQWLVPELDVRLLRLHKPSVFTAHDLLPRRTAGKQDLWRRLLDRFDASSCTASGTRNPRRARRRRARHPAPCVPERPGAPRRRPNPQQVTTSFVAKTPHTRYLPSPTPRPPHTAKLHLTNCTQTNHERCGGPPSATPLRNDAQADRREPATDPFREAGPTLAINTRHCKACPVTSTQTENSETDPPTRKHANTRCAVFPVTRRSSARAVRSASARRGVPAVASRRRQEKHSSASRHKSGREVTGAPERRSRQSHTHAEKPRQN